MKYVYIYDIDMHITLKNYNVGRITFNKTETETGFTFHPSCAGVTPPFPSGQSEDDKHLFYNVQIRQICSQFEIVAALRFGINIYGYREYFGQKAKNKFF